MLKKSIATQDIAEVIMAKVLINCILCVTMLMGGNMKSPSIQQYLTTASQAKIIIEGKYFEANVLELNKVVDNILKDSYSIPALGVSIHTETIMQMQKGVWIKLQYNGTQWLDNMNFDELLIEVNPEFMGFNIIRGNVGIYEGRCYYINLTNTDMAELYNYCIALADIN